MKKRKIIALLILVVLILLVALIPSGLLGDFWKKISGPTGNTISGNVISESKLIAHYKFENNVLDSAGHNNGLNHGCSFGKGKVGNALIVDGVDDFVSVSGINNEMFNGQESFTLATWYKPTSDTFRIPDGEQSYFFGGTFNNYGLWLNKIGGALKLGHSYSAKNSDGAYVSINDSEEVELNTWYYLASTYDYNSKEICLYINGELIRCTDSSLYGELMLVDKSKSQFSIGGLPTGFSSPAAIDSTKIWNYALSSDEIKKEYDSYFEVESEEQETGIEESTGEQEGQAASESLPVETDSKARSPILYWLLVVIIALSAIILYLIYEKKENR